VVIAFYPAMNIDMEKSNETPKTFGKRLRAIRRKLFLDQKQFSIKMGISSPYMSAFENDRHFPKMKFLLKLNTLFDVNLNYLILGIGDMFIQETEFLKARAPEFAVNLEHVSSFLFHFEHSEIVQFACLSTFREIMIKQREVIKKELAQSDSQNNK